MKFARTENKKSSVPKHLGTLKKKKLPLFDKGIIIQRNAFLSNV